MPHVEQGRVVETATEARAGRPGVPVLYMLVSGTVGVVVLFTVVYLYFFT
ncbi:MAG TPA: hypothetical protein VGC38_05475 [Pseudolabrys sp.]